MSNSIELSELRKELKKMKGIGEITVNKIMEQLERRNFKEASQQYCYSWDGEDYSNGLFGSQEEAIADARSSDLDADEVYIGIAVMPDIRWNSNEEQIIESIRENLREDCGEYAEDGLEVTTIQEIDLGKMIDSAVAEWIQKHHIKPICYKVIEIALHVFEED